MEHKINDYLSYDEIIKGSKGLGIDVTWRKLNYYKSLGLLPKATKNPGDKRGFYPHYIINQLSIYQFLQNDLSYTLDGIKKLFDKFKTPAHNFQNKSKNMLFIMWIELTYGYFLKSALKVLEEDYKILLGVRSMLLINLNYKLHLEINGMTYLQDRLMKDVKEGRHSLECEALAKTWAAKAAEHLRVKSKDMFESELISLEELGKE